MAALDEKVAKDPELDEDSDDDEDEMPVREPGPGDVFSRRERLTGG